MGRVRFMMEFELVGAADRFTFGTGGGGLGGGLSVLYVVQLNRLMGWSCELCVEWVVSMDLRGMTRRFAESA